MKRSICLSIICACALNLYAVELSEIKIESSTIEDDSYDKKTEVSTVNIINEKTIEDINPKNINELLQTIPGITADVRTSGVEIHIRGIGQQEFMGEDTGVAIVIDGVPVMQNGGKVKFNVDEIESIKVIKGGASYLYGNTALAGAVIITTKRNKDKNSADIKVETGSYGYKNAELNAYKSTQNYSANINVNYTDDDSYWGEEGKTWTKSANGKFQYYINDDSDITFGLNYTDKFEAGGGSVTGITNADLFPKGVIGDWSYLRDYYSTLQKYFAIYSSDFANGDNLKIHTYYYRDQYDYKSSPQDTSGDGLDDSYRNDNNDDIKEYGVKLEYKGNIDKLAYMIGTDIGQRKLDNYTLQLVDSRRGTAGDTAEGDTTEKNYALYAETKYPLTPKLTFVLNGRYDYNRYSYDSNTRKYNSVDWDYTQTTNHDSFKNFSYRIGTTYVQDKAKIFFANLSTGFRNPRVSQIYKGDYDTDYVNNPNLKQETTVNYELGMRGEYNIFSYEASLFVTNTKNIIAKNSGTYYSNNTDIMYDNVGDARNQGLELSVNSDRNKNLSFSASYTYLDAYYIRHNLFMVDYAPLYRDRGEDVAYDITNNQLPRVPHHKFNLITYYKLLHNLELMGTLYAQSSYYADETNFATMPGYAIVNLKATYQANKKLALYVQMNNIFDKQYFRTTYLYSDKNEDGRLNGEDASITVDPGRMIYAGLKYRF